jgi:hypothetical protein
MGDYALIRWLSMLWKGTCTVNIYLRVICTALAFVAWDSFNARQTSKDERVLERVQISRQLQLLELERQADHKLLLELLEAVKYRRDLSLPADPDEGY